jgi:uncharacterized protein
MGVAAGGNEAPARVFVPSLDTPRDRHLFGPGPKRLLTLDGGGVRGAITVAFLEKIEAMVRERHGRDKKLCDYFDLIGGTSTGSIIAGALALGMTVAEVKKFYFDLAPLAFKRQSWGIPYLHALFDARSLRREIVNVVGDRLLSTPDLLTGFGMVAKRMDTGSPWILTNNPGAPFWEDGPKGSYVGNKRFPMATLVRASTAAPRYFDPEIIEINKVERELPSIVAKPFALPAPLRVLTALVARTIGGRVDKIDPNTHGLFVDGGVSPHNNPTLAMFHHVTLRPFNICWPLGPDKLTVVSIGTGTYRPRLSYDDLGFGRFAKLAFHSLMSLMSDSQMLVLALMQFMGECPAPWPINAEIGTLANEIPRGGKAFRFLRYDVRLETDWIRDELGRDVSEAELERYRAMDDPRIVEKIYDLACIAASKQFKPEHWPMAEAVPGFTAGQPPGPTA